MQCWRRCLRSARRQPGRRHGPRLRRSPITGRRPLKSRSPTTPCLPLSSTNEPTERRASPRRSTEQARPIRLRGRPILPRTGSGRDCPPWRARATGCGRSGIRAATASRASSTISSSLTATTAARTGSIPSSLSITPTPSIRASTRASPTSGWTRRGIFA